MLGVEAARATVSMRIVLERLETQRQTGNECNYEQHRIPQNRFETGTALAGAAGPALRNPGHGPGRVPDKFIMSVIDILKRHNIFISPPE